MKIAAIIPSRYESSRYRGKPLVKIKGVTMIERVFRQVQSCSKFSNIIVATDDERILNTVMKFGGQAVMTSPEHRSGTERIWEVLQNSDYDAVVNIQGDEPLVPEKLIADLFEELESGRNPVVTAAYFNTSKLDYVSEHVVKVVFDKNNHALYFSRSPLPYMKKTQSAGFYQHIGIYGYLKDTVRAFIESKTSKLEQSESLEQLRFLENGIPIKIIFSEEQSIGVDVPGDIEKIEKLLEKKGKR